MPNTQSRAGAFACSGLGRVRRGNETWARTVAEAVTEAGLEIHLIGGGPMEVRCRYEFLPNLPRDGVLWRRWLSWHQRYLWEQRTFSWALRRRIGRRDIDLLHLTDPLLAELARRWAPPQGIPVVYKDGLLLGAEWCSRFEWVQVLAPYYREQAAAKGKDVSQWVVIPHLVNTDDFSPAPNSQAARALCPGGPVPSGVFMGLAVGDLSPQSNKRLQWVVEEFAGIQGPRAPHLLLAGQASASDLVTFEASARALLGERVHIRPNIRPDQMPGLYRAADAFVHAATREPFGIVFLEAMACGVPILAHHYEVSRWIVGDAGLAIDMEASGLLAARVRAWRDEPAACVEAGCRARARARSVFDRRRIVPLYSALESRMRDQRKAVPR